MMRFLTSSLSLTKIVSTLLILQNIGCKECPFNTPNLVLFKTIPQENETLSGTCIQNAEQEAGDDGLTISCYEDGNYTTTGQCLCSPGFFLNDRSTCTECKEGFSKADVGNEMCKYQGRNTIVCASTERLCACEDKFFRITEEKYIEGTNCYETGHVRRIYYSNHTDGSVIVTWKSPFNKPGYQPTFLVSTNNAPYKRMTRKSLFFPKSNHTRQYKIDIITEVKVGEDVHTGDSFTSTITVHKTRDSSGVTIRPNIRISLYFTLLSIILFYNIYLR